MKLLSKIKDLFKKKKIEKIDPKGLKTGQHISFQWGSKTLTGRIIHNFKDYDKVFLKRTDVRGMEYLEVHYTQVKTILQ